MPLIEFVCLDCGKKQTRLGNLKDRVALCTCQGLMLRPDDDDFAPLLAQIPAGAPLPPPEAIP